MIRPPMTFRRIGSVRIMHPGCSRLILSLPAFSRTPAPGTDLPPPRVPSIDHLFVLDACRVVTNDAAKGEGYLSKDSAGGDRVPPMTSGDALPPGEYFYHLGPPLTTPSTNYPIVTDFSAWKFPKEIPGHWRQHPRSEKVFAHFWRKYEWCGPRDMRLAVKFEDNGCIVTNFPPEGCEAVHLVPPSWQERWFRRNNMRKYNWSRLTGIDDPANGVSLRGSLAKFIGLNALVFFPDRGGGYMTYVCQTMCDYYYDLLHGTRVAMSPRVADQFLYARFAYTIIALVARNPGLEAFPLPEGVKPSRKPALLKAPADDDEDYE